MNSNKRMFFFDIDNTILSSRSQTILPQTLKTIKTLSGQSNTLLGIATGRNIKRLNVLSEIQHCFKHLVLFNGGLTQINDKVIDDRPFDKKEVQNLIDKAHAVGMKIGMTGLYQEIVPSEQDLISPTLGYKYCTNKNSVVEPTFHLNNNVYQIWLFEPNNEKLEKFIKDLGQFEIYYWRTHCGVDLVRKGVNKIHGIRKIKALYPEYKLICMGDGENDVDMIKYSDIGIGIGLSHSHNEGVKKHAKLIAPDIEEDKLYDFFIKNNLF
ncbi:HAD family hydrolase [Candidatus Phytoplasma ziziphi]|uniref:HAD family hydrolase n=1 Tax=Ziziphus jujuba witches'-broom phytoplasma TaxID=135727 RepID=A0A660HMW0_ZIZJU|nr:HAD family hydrolase [Candidatus Phytoplasma ziziphi]AYJ01322.1 HAD family hydrolase [Candidatus Phytoplasma ziziphi]